MSTVGNGDSGHSPRFASYVVERGGRVTASEIVDVRHEPGAKTPARELLWERCVTEALCVVTARAPVTAELLGIAFVVGNSRHCQVVDLAVHRDARRCGIATAILRECLAFVKDREVQYVGLTWDADQGPWLREWYRRQGFADIDFAMWLKGSLKKRPI